MTDRPKRRARRKQEEPAETAPPPAQRYCDVVMKGGITSGVVYPLAMVELSTAFRFKNIGGTSAGAIAAAFTAAAEFGRDTRTGGFARLGALPPWFAEQAPDGSGSNLFALFTPARRTRGLFRIFTAGIGFEEQPVRRWFRQVLAALTVYPLRAAAGALPGLLLAVWAALAGAGVLGGVTVATGLLLAFLGLAGAVSWSMYRGLFRHVAANGYGLCTGYHPRAENGETPISLAEWVAEQIDLMAGRDPAKDPPLTFRDLWAGAEAPSGEPGPGVNLQTMTTNLTQGRPMRLPFEDSGAKGFGQYYFLRSDMERLLPPRLVEWLVDHAAPRPDRAPAPVDGETLIPLPRAADMPVAVAVRLSMSYPLLLSAVPLYTVDWTRQQPESSGGAKRGRGEGSLLAERCWFSDGGVTSNFPVHFFDQPLPRWPTFAINLRPPHPDKPDRTVWMPRSNKERGVAVWHRFDNPGRPSLSGFIGTIKDVGQNWADNEQARVPGYRDRIVHITVDKAEGGANLKMTPDLVAELGERGRRAGRLLVERFASGPEWDVNANWNSHRWVRYRSTMHVVEELLLHLRASYRYKGADAASYADLISRPLDRPPLDHRWWNVRQQQHAITVTEELARMVESWKEAEQTFGKVTEDDAGPPQPYPMLRIVPRV